MDDAAASPSVRLTALLRLPDDARLPNNEREEENELLTAIFTLEALSLRPSVSHCRYRSLFRRERARERGSEPVIFPAQSHDTTDRHLLIRPPGKINK